MSNLQRAIETVIDRCLGVRADESLLVICNLATGQLGELFRSEAERAQADAVLAVMSERPSNGAEPPRPIVAAMLESDVVLAPTVQSLSHTEARKAATDAGVRIATLPGVTEAMLARAMSVDLHALTNRTLAVAEALTIGGDVHVTSAAGTDFRFSIGDRKAICDAGQLTGPGAFGNLPCGEGYVAPQEGTAQGTLVVDGSIATFGIVPAPVTLTIEDGYVVSAAGGFGPDFLKTLGSFGEPGTNVAEFGIGTNDKATLTGDVLEDEKILGTVHVAFGASAGIGGTVQIPIHLDCVALNPTVEIDGHQLVESGRLLV